MKAPRPSGYVIYDGPSTQDGAPIVVIAVTGHKPPSKMNSKTGDMLQTYIIRSDVDPVSAVHGGLDVSICGDCKHRGDGTGKGRTCYVTLMHGPASVYRAFKRGIYPYAGVSRVSDYRDSSLMRLREIAELGQGRMVRLGTYGDPAMVPAYIWRALVSGAEGRTGYTHQWRTRADLSDLVMASCDNVAEFDLARSSGWRAFVVRPMSTPVPAGTVTCPASEEAGKRTTCLACHLCDGVRPGDKRKSITIMAHGTARRAFTGGAS